MSDGLVANETTISIVLITFGDSLIDSAQVQVDSIVQMPTAGKLIIDRSSTGRQHHAD